MQRGLPEWYFSISLPALSTSVTMALLIPYVGTPFPHLYNLVSPRIKTLLGKPYMCIIIRNVYIGLLLTKLRVKWCYWLFYHVALWLDTGNLGRGPGIWALRIASYSPCTFISGRAHSPSSLSEGQEKGVDRRQPPLHQFHFLCFPRHQRILSPHNNHFQCSPCRRFRGQHGHF